MKKIKDWYISIIIWKMVQYTINSVSFQNVTGIDAGGLRPEFFNLVLKDIFNSSFDLKVELDSINP